MKSELVRQTLIDRARHHAETLEQAARSIIDGLGLDQAEVMEMVAQLRRVGQRNRLLDSPPGVVRNHTHQEAQLAGWYTGPEDGDHFWPTLRAQLQNGSLAAVVDDIDAASTKVVANLGDPTIRRLQKKGLVVGYVQSGKTANYTAVMAKAADAGFRLFIVMSGMHNNLRRQTQVRLEKDLLSHEWAQLTTAEADFGSVVNGAAMMARGVHMVAVVKKNGSRLTRLRDWLRDIPEETRARCPVLLLDDEADQATPNTMAAKDEVSRINLLIRQIWAELPTASYVGYTATPFANVFMDPNDTTDLYPEDFIVDLPRPAAYFGAEQIFGLSDTGTADSDAGLNMVRTIPAEEAEMLRPPSKAGDRTSWEPELPDSLIDACVWFFLSSAIRRVRGQADQHSSMLVHTSQFVASHFAMKDAIDQLCSELTAEVMAKQLDRFEEAFRREHGCVELPADSVTWGQVAAELPAVLSEVRIIVDNGVSQDRLDYGRVDEDGHAIVETVIAIGGGTLSRGLTLEGLVVSYFTRTTSTYDTLLQMGRWFGYRPGYEDLPRVWVTSEVEEEFQFLARVEMEIRDDMRRLEVMGVSPRQLGVKVRAHPGRLAITAANKMHFANPVQISFSGQRHQTILFHETDRQVQETNIGAARDLLNDAATFSEAESAGPHTLFRSVPSQAVRTFLGRYVFHPDQSTLRRDHITGWIDRIASETPWNVVLMSRSASDSADQIDLGLARPTSTISRAPLSSSQVGLANIKALMSPGDAVIDLGDEAVRQAKARRPYRDIRAAGAGGRGLIAIYPISASSEPSSAALAVGSRRRLHSSLPLIGLGLVFPEVDLADVSEDGNYFAVTPDWEMTYDDAESEALPADTEASAQIDGNIIAARALR